jgi:bifunctional non-homologous end joining protein LigD
VIAGKKVVLSGTVPGESRHTAHARLTELGAIVQTSLSATTELLIVGAKPGPQKVGKAKERGIPVVPWEQAVIGGAAGRLARFVASGDTDVLLEGLPSAPPKAQARVVAPMLAKGGELPRGNTWTFEVKWDGYRGVATVQDGAVSIRSRSAKTDYAEQYPAIAAELAALPDCVLDGELIAIDAEGRSSFATIHQGQGGGAYMLFDLLELRGVDLRDRPLAERRAELALLLGSYEFEAVALSPVFDDGDALLARVAELGMEGVVAKRWTSRYVEGARTDAWTKVKVRLEQEFVVVGWIEGEGEAAGAPGSMLLAVNDDAGELQYVGKVGTGGTWADWQSIETLTRPAAEGPAPTVRTGVYERMSGTEVRKVVWVVPELVVQVRFQRWTEDGALWHPSWQGVRHDKDASEVRREEVR